MSDTNPAALFNAAFAKAQGEYRLAAKNRTATETDPQTGDQRTWQYADLDEVLWAVREALCKHGLAISQPISPVPGSNGLHLITKITHEGGGEISSVVPLSSPQSFLDIKAFGAELTLLRRYSAEALLGITSYFDDNAVTGAPQSMAKRGSSDFAVRGRTDDGSSFEKSGDFKSSRPAEDCYSQEAFDASLDGWKLGVAQRMTTPERIVQMVETKYPLTDEQREIILAIEVPQP